MDFLTTLSRTLGFSFAAGVNLYATVAILGLASRYQWVDLPDQFRVFNNNWIIGAALVLYLLEFVADKIPWVDSLWDAVHTVIRPAGAAFIAVASIGHAQPTVQVVAALVGAALASSSHLASISTVREKTNIRGVWGQNQPKRTRSDLPPSHGIGVG